MTLFQQTIFSAILLQLCLIPQVLHGQQQTLCVRASDSSTLSSECRTFKDWYSNNSNAAFSSNTMLRFEKGFHLLHIFINISNCHNFAMVGNESAQHNNDGLPQPTSIISCLGAPDAGLIISDSSNIRIHNLEFKFCSGFYTLKEKYSFTASLVFYRVQDMSLDQVVVNSTAGYGIHTVNIYGTNEIMDSAFLNASINEHMNVTRSGNADFYFNDFSNEVTVLVVKSSWFMYGKNNITAGGLNVEIYNTNVHVKITNVTAKGNTGYNGGNMALFVTLFTTNYGSIIIENSHILEGRATHGGGINIVTKPKEMENNKGLLCQHHGIQHFLKITNTLFHKNVAHITGGAMYIIYKNINTEAAGIRRKMIIMKCNFTENVGDGAAMEIKQLNHYIIPQLNTSIEKCRFENNFTPSNLVGPVVDLISVEVSVTNSTFSGSNTTAISLRNSCLRLFGDILFENNVAMQLAGGALKFCEASIMYAHTNTNVRFINNTAKKGGAIYVQQHCMDTKPLCFLQFLTPKFKPSVIQTKFTFINNSAVIAGHSVYGGDIDQCSIIGYSSRNFWFSKEIYEEIFIIEESHRQSEISSDPRGVCFCHNELKEYYNSTCTATIRELKKYPGEKFTLSIITVGQMNGSTSGIVSTILEGESKNHTLIGNNNPKSNASCVDLTLALHSNQMTANITFKPVISEFFTHFGTIFPTVIVHLLPCPIGFQFSDKDNYCICSPLLLKVNFFVDSQVECNISSHAVSIQQRRIWFGCLHPEHENQSSTCADNSEIVVVPNCDYYCRISNNKTINVLIHDLDSQCLPGHTGILCGACKPGYSRILGGALECQKGCTNHNLPIIIFFFLVFNILLVIFIMFLNLTVTQGTLNGLLAYTMVIQTHRTYFPDDASGFG